jgi:hypothetical protein
MPSFKTRSEVAIDNDRTRPSFSLLNTCDGRTERTEARTKVRRDGRMARGKGQDGKDGSTHSSTDRRRDGRSGERGVRMEEGRG